MTFGIVTYDDIPLKWVKICKVNEIDEKNYVLISRFTKAESLLVVAGCLTWAMVTWIGVQHDIQIALSPAIRAFNLGLYCLFLILFLLLTRNTLVPKRKRLAQLASGTMLVTVGGLLFCSGQSLLPILLVIWASLLPDFFSRRSAILQIITVNLSYYLWLKWQLQVDGLLTTLIYAGFQFFAFSSSQARLSERESRQAQHQLNLQLVATQSLLAQTSEQQERLRISRDLHDILGHQLTALSLQLEVLSHQAPDTLKTNVNQSKTLAKDLLESIRAVVRAQRGKVGLDLRPPLQAMMHRLPGIELNYAEMIPLTSHELTQALLLVIQEGISNAIRHGNANQLTLSMTNAASQMKIMLTDNGAGLTQGQISPQGIGLKGMKERLAPFLGTVHLQANTPDAGCTLTLSLSLTQ